jgi:flagellar motility protein MotE (MotC chaperone)
MQIRIIPATITIALMLLGMRVVDVVTQANDARAAAAEEKPAEAKEGEAKKEEPKKDGEAKKEDAHGGGHDEAKKEEKKNPAVSDVAGETVDYRFTPIEVDLLQNLAKRREDLQRWEKNIEIKENALNATEKRIEDRIVQIESMRKEVTELLAQYNEKEDAKVRSLVKIYQAMKPKDAARIFDELDMPILLMVVDKMPEKTTAPILSLMDPKKAKQVTVQLAEKNQVSKPMVVPPAITPAPAAAPTGTP